MIAAVHRTVAAQLASLWTFIALGSSVIVVEELTPVLAGFAAHQNHLPVYRTVVVCALGGWLATLVPYWLGRHGASRLLRRFPQAEQASERLGAIVTRRPWWSGMVSRFLFGARFLLPLACGTARVRRVPFLVGSAVSAAAWATLYFTAGYLFGDAMVALVGRVRRHELLYGSILAVVVLLVLWLAARKNMPHVEEELEAFPD